MPAGRPQRRHLPARPVHHRDQMQKPPPHRNIRDVRAPDLVRPTVAMAAPAQVPHHLPRAVERGFQELLVDPPHQRQVRFALAGRRVVEAGAADPEQHTLPRHRQMRVFGSDPRPPPCRAHRPEAFSEKPVPSPIGRSSRAAGRAPLRRETRGLRPWPGRSPSGPQLLPSSTPQPGSDEPLAVPRSPPASARPGLPPADRDSAWRTVRIPGTTSQ